MKNYFILTVGCTLLLSLAVLSQNVGIGTPTPVYKLDVLGRMRVKTGTLGDVFTSAGIWFDDFRNGNNQIFFGMKDSTHGGFYGATSGWNLVFDAKTGIFSNKFNLNGPVNFYDGITNTLAGNITPDSNDIYINARLVQTGNKGNLVLQANPRNFLGYAGNVGIGIDSPVYKLALNGDFGMYNGSTFLGLMSNNSNDLMLNAKLGNSLTSTTPQNLILQYTGTAFSSSGRVGIGTGAPLAKLHINGSGELLRTGSSATGIQYTDDYLQFVNGSVGKFFMQSSGNNFIISPSTGNNTSVLTLNGNQVTIGQITPANGYKLSIGGKVMCEELKVLLQTNWPDYVFKDVYKLRSFDELRKFIASNNHLPNIPAAAEIEKSGLQVGEMQSKMMEKIEELTLYILQLEEKMNEIKKQLANTK